MTTLGAGRDEPRGHAIRLFVIWGVLSVLAVVLVVWVLGPQLPPGSMTSQAHGQTFANIVLTAVCVPIALFVVIFFAYSLWAFRARGSTADGPPIRTNGTVMMVWLATTVVIVMGLAIWGSYELFPGQTGAGGGSGPSPIFKPEDAKLSLPVQVIGQQWLWTFRYPTYGGVESPKLAIPAHRYVALHVTSLDVTHSFWAYKLGVKADAVPGVDNIAYVNAKDTGPFTVRCAELCGLWHGHMYTKGVVLTSSQFASWIARTRHRNALSTPFLPPFSFHYFPEPQRRAG
jgi:cytochrome c oxidase subunit II